MFSALAHVYGFGHDVGTRTVAGRITRRVLAGLLIICAIAAFAMADATEQPTQPLSTAKLIATPHMEQPAYLDQAQDPLFGTSFTRVTDPGTKGTSRIGCGPAYCVHRYSSIQAWNADQSLLLITNGCHGWCFLDGQTYELVFQRRTPSACEWHPRNAEIMICVHHNAVLSWAPRANKVSILWQTEDYTALKFGPLAGNLSHDGNRIALRARNAEGGLVAFAVDLAANQKLPDIALSDLISENNYVSISPSGRYIYLFQEPVDGVEKSYVFTASGRQLQHWTEHHRPGHGDMTIDAAGDDVYVGVSKSEPDKWHIIKRRLRDGQVTVLAPSGYGSHVSARNINLPGWVFVSYGGKLSEFIESDTGMPDHAGRAPFYQEVIALRIDGSGQVRRFAQTRSTEHDYWSETHASPSPDGSQVIWSSDWGQAGAPIADYVSRLAWSGQQTTNPSRASRVNAQEINSEKPQKTN